MSEKSRILIIGATGYLGKYLIGASVKAGHPTFALVRETAASDPAKAKLLEDFSKLGVKFIYGDINDHEKLLKAIKEVDVVISSVNVMQTESQTKIIDAIKEAGHIKRFFPSDFGTDVDTSNAIGPAKSVFDEKAKIRRVLEAERIPHTNVASHGFFGFFIPSLAQPGLTSPPRDKVTILGDGNPRAIFVEEGDIAEYTIRAVDDPRTVNKVLHIRPPKNILSFNEVVALWEKKIGKTLEKVYVQEDQILKDIKESPHPKNLYLSLQHAVFVVGDQTNYKIDPRTGVEASEIYPDVKYTTVEEYMDRFV